jgi:hypothetical protein
VISVSTNFKEAVKNPIRRMYAEFDDGSDPITADDDLKSLTYSVFGDIGKAIMRKVELSYFGSHTYTSGEPSWGVYVANVIDKGNVTISIADPAIVTLNDHGLLDGNRIKLSTTGDLPTGLEVDTSYYVIEIDDDTFKLATTFNNAMLGTAIATSGTQSGTHSLDYYEAGIGNSTEQIDLGTFYVYKKSVDVQQELTTISLYDKMYEALKPYNNTSVDYPVTLKQYLQALCTDLDWTLATATFPNDDMDVDTDLFAFQGKTYRDVLNQIAEATGTTMYFNNDDELVLKSVGGAVQENIVADYLKSIDMDNEWGDINSIIFRNNPVETNWVWYGGYYHRPYLYENGYPILLENGEELRTERFDVRDDLYQIRIDNNLFIGEDQENFMTDLVTALMDYSYIPFESKTVGLGYFEVGDTITLTDHNDSSYTTTIFQIELDIAIEGFAEVLSAETLDLGIQTEQKEVGVVEQIVRKTPITGYNIDNESIVGDKLEDDTVSSAKIKELTADKIATGSLTVGTEIIIPDDAGRALIYIANVEE